MPPGTVLHNSRHNTHARSLLLQPSTVHFLRVFMVNCIRVVVDESLHTHKAMGSRRKEHDARIFNILLQRCRCRRNHVQQNASASFHSTNLMQLIVLHRCCGDGMSCHAHAELRAANKQCVKLPSRVESSKHVTSGSHGTNLGEFMDDFNR